MDASASKSMAVLIFMVVFVLWCWLVLYVTRLKANLRAAKTANPDDALATPEPHHPMPGHFADDPSFSSPGAEARYTDPNARPFDRSPSGGAQSPIGPNGRAFVRR